MLDAHPDISVLGGAVEMFLHGDDTKKKVRIFDLNTITITIYRIKISILARRTSY